ncbi:pantothenate kinase [Leptolyngbya cf. ectocarpi LEGE 11479]|uniref:Type III pantothenate kinase n=1 Tax=Leptolyngbya cf. ectocarpi LEGE 11479 TaxID=1828722 RepID=A0A928ZVX9_LEPEC|nr:pantothenate kinase [Leptolyngbya ectocarpi]MBE9068477.1 pantothenate kinase [Leptolyngbya cf. ectocarpi LEGE 11479]
MANWLALVIGNTRWHWAWFKDNALKQVWHTPHLLPSQDLRSVWAEQTPPQLLATTTEPMNIWAVSVVPSQAQYLDPIPAVRWIDHVPLKGVYTTLGLDRVVALWGAGHQYGWPVLVIDGGTALTFTAGAEGAFSGGAILLGLRSHFTALHDHTAALPNISLPGKLPPHWAKDTPSAIQSGVIHTLLAGVHSFIQSWHQQHPTTAVLFTGGDGQYLYQLYQQIYQTQQNQVLRNRTWFDPNLMFWGISAYRREATRAL